MQFVLATQNAGKIREFSRILQPLGIEILSSAQAGVDFEIEETGTSFEENAKLKAEAVCKFTGLPAIADDSGLVVDYLDGAPGIYSARYGGPDLTDDQRCDKILSQLENIPLDYRSAHFACAIYCAFPEKDGFCVMGTCPGYIGYEKAGQDGFGYDPIFYVQGCGSFAQMPAEEKDAISHRGRAVQLLLKKLKEKM